MPCITRAPQSLINTYLQNKCFAVLYEIGIVFYNGDDMKAHYNYTRILVNDMAASIRFYRDALGFTLRMGNENEAYCEFVNEGHVLSLFLKPLMDEIVGASAQSAHVDVILLALAVENVDAAYAELTAKGVTFVAPPTDRPEWGLRTAHFRDPDGLLLELNHDIPMHS